MNDLQPTGFTLMPPAIKTIILVCVGLFFLQQIRDLDQLMIMYGAVWSFSSDYFHVWQLVTYSFLHGGFWHLFFNMYVLWIFGQELENLWGTRHFTFYYFICGIGGATLNALIANPNVPTIGASGSIYGVLLAYGLMFPNRIVYFYFLFPIKIKYLVMVYIVVEFVSGVSGVATNVAHFAHLGGMLFGYLYIKIMNGEIPLSEWFRKSSSSMYVSQSPKVNISVNKLTQKEQDKRINEILDKISKTGYDSISEDEKKFLIDVSKNRN